MERAGVLLEQLLAGGITATPGTGRPIQPRLGVRDTTYAVSRSIAPWAYRQYRPYGYARRTTEAAATTTAAYDNSNLPQRRSVPQLPEPRRLSRISSAIATSNAIRQAQLWVTSNAIATSNAMGDQQRYRRPATLFATSNAIATSATQRPQPTATATAHAAAAAATAGAPARHDAAATAERDRQQQGQARQREAQP